MTSEVNGPIIRPGIRMANILRCLSPGGREVHWRDVFHATYEHRAEHLTDSQVQERLGGIITRTNRMLAKTGLGQKIVPGNIKRTYVLTQVD